MNNDLLAQADAADREADELFATIKRASDALPPDALGFRLATPQGQEGNSARAVELRARARALRAQAGPQPKSVTPPPPVVAPAPAAAVSTTARPGLTVADAEAVVAAVDGERKRSAAIIREAHELGIASEHVDAALASNMTADQFVERYAPAEHLARQIARTAEEVFG